MESGQKSPEPEEIRREIEQTRAELGETVEALAEKADVKKRTTRKVAKTQASVKAKAAQVQEKVSEGAPPQARRTAVQAAESVRERPLRAITVGALAGVLVVGLMLARR